MWGKGCSLRKERKFTFYPFPRNDPFFSESIYKPRDFLLKKSWNSSSAIESATCLTSPVKQMQNKLAPFQPVFSGWLDVLPQLFLISVHKWFVLLDISLIEAVCTNRSRVVSRKRLGSVGRTPSLEALPLAGCVFATVLDKLFNLCRDSFLEGWGD